MQLCGYLRENGTVGFRNHILVLPTVYCGAYDPNDANQVIYVADTDNNRIIKLRVNHDKPGNSPPQVFEAFKAALWIGDIDKAVTFFIDPVAKDYRAIFEELSDDLQDMVNDMGEMSLYMSDDGMAVYEFSNSSGTKLYPVIFSMDEEGNWKISKF